ncbi:hypothetical protein V6N12_037151, partial [Hibiscus sabdariffa]
GQFSLLATVAKHLATRSFLADICWGESNKVVVVPLEALGEISYKQLSAKRSEYGSSVVEGGGKKDPRNFRAVLPGFVGGWASGKAL